MSPAPTAERARRARKPVVPFGNMTSSEDARGVDDDCEDEDDDDDDQFDGEYREGRKRREGSSDDEDGEERKASSTVKKDKPKSTPRISKAKRLRTGVKLGKKTGNEVKKAIPLFKSQPMKKKVDLSTISKPKPKAATTQRAKSLSKDEVGDKPDYSEGHEDGSDEDQSVLEIGSSDVSESKAAKIGPSSPTYVTEESELDHPSPSPKPKTKPTNYTPAVPRKQKKETTNSDEEAVEAQIDSAPRPVGRNKKDRPNTLAAGSKIGAKTGAPIRPLATAASKRPTGARTTKSKFAGLQPLFKPASAPVSSSKTVAGTAKSGAKARAGSKPKKKAESSEEEEEELEDDD